MKRVIVFIALTVFFYSCKQHIGQCSYPKEFATLDSLSIFDTTTKVKLISIISEEDDAVSRLDYELLLNNVSLKRFENNKLNEEVYADLYQRALNSACDHTIIEASQQLANYYHVQKKIKESMPYYFRAYRLYKVKTSQEIPQKFRYLYEIGAAFFSYGNYSSSQEFLKEALQYPYYDYGMVAGTLNTLGLSYRAIEKYDSAIYYFRKGHDLAVQKGNKEWQSIYEINEASVEYKLKNYSTALELFRRYLENPKTRNDILSNAETALYIAKIKLEQGTPDSAFYYLCKAQQLSVYSNDRSLKFKQDLFRTFYNFYRITRNTKEFLKYADSCEKITDTLSKILSAQSVMKAQQIMDKEYYTQSYENEIEKHRLVRNFSVLVCIALGIIVFLLIRNIKNTQRQNRFQKLQMQREIQQAEKKLTEFTANLEDKNRMIEQLESLRLEQDIKKNEEERFALIRELEQSVLLTDEQWTNFAQTFEQVYGNFLLRMRTNYPNLRQSDIRIISLMKLNLSNKAMAGMLGVTSDAIRMSKHRIRKKLELPENTELEQFIQNLASN